MAQQAKSLNILKKSLFNKLSKLKDNDTAKKYVDRLDLSKAIQVKNPSNRSYQVHNANCSVHGIVQPFAKKRCADNNVLDHPCEECRYELKGRRGVSIKNANGRSLDAIKSLPNLFSNILISDTNEDRIYKQTEYIDVECRIHKCKTKSLITSLRDGKTSCPKCAYSRSVEANKKNVKTGKDNSLTLDFDLVADRIFKKSDGKFILKEYRLNGKKSLIHCTEHGIDFQQPVSDIFRFNGCPKCKKWKVSYLEEKLIKFFNDHDIKFIHEDSSKIKRSFIKDNKKYTVSYDLDFFLPDFNIGIECHGNYWHSELSGKSAKTVEIDYLKANGLKHKEIDRIKYNECKKQGITLLIFYEDEIIDKFHQVSNMILSKCKLLTNNRIFARKTEAYYYTFDSDDKETNHFISEFFNVNHIQGICRFKYATLLTYNEEIVSIMLFNDIISHRGVTASKEDIELVRYATKDTVVGGASKLLKHFLTNYKYKEDLKRIVSYSDLRYSIGNMYEQIGFTMTLKGKPDYFYVSPKENFMIRHTKSNFQKSKILAKSNKNIMVYHSDKTEYELCYINEFYRIWDLGRAKWELIIN